MPVATNQRWSARVTRTGNALDLEQRVAPFRCAMSMLTFHINRGGKGLPASQRKVLQRAKGELRKLYGREPA